MKTIATNLGIHLKDLSTSLNENKNFVISQKPLCSEEVVKIKGKILYDPLVQFYATFFFL